MDERLNQIFNEGECISQEKLIAYVNGTLSPIEQHLIDKHLLECELCSDAVEGYLLQENNKNISSTINELNSRISNEILLDNNDDEKIKVMFPWQMAAAFALLIVSGFCLWFFLPKNDSQKLFTQEFKPFPKTENTVTNNQIASEPNLLETTSASTSDKSTNEKAINVEKKEKIAPKNVSMQDEKKMEVIASDQVEMVASKEENNFDKSIAQGETKEEISSTQNNTGNQAISSPTMAVKAASPSMKRSVAGDLNSVAYKEGIAAYQNGEYELAIKLLNGVSDNREAMFYSGLSYLSIGKAIEAVNKLEAFRNAGTHELTEASWWYEALANLKLNDKKSAEKCLNQVIQLNGTYKKKAEQLLQKI